MITEEEEKDISKMFSKVQNRVDPQVRNNLYNFLKREDIPHFDHLKFFFTLRFIYRQSLSESLTIINDLIKRIERDLNSLKDNKLNGFEKCGLSYVLSTLGIKTVEIAKMLNVSRNTIVRWRKASGKVLIASWEKNIGKLNSPYERIKIFRKYFNDDFTYIMQFIEKELIKHEKKLTPKNLELYLSQGYYSRHSLSKFISKYNKIKTGQF